MASFWKLFRLNQLALKKAHHKINSVAVRMCVKFPIIASNIESEACSPIPG